jgi:peptidoglycan/LPS O-acetylase OafA/YrhL
MSTLAMLSLVHVFAGAIGLALGPIVMSATKRRGPHTRMGLFYFAIVTTVCASAAVLAVLHWSTRWWFLPIAIGTFASAAIAYWAARRRPRHWVLMHVGGQLSSYTGMATAFVVNNWERLTGVPGLTPVAFLLPMSIGTLATAWLLREVHLGRRPRFPQKNPTPRSN